MKMDAQSDEDEPWKDDGVVDEMDISMEPPIIDENKVQTRAYQAEMLEASLRGNIIVTMDTGSGKTHIAIIRILAELERSPNTISWFLTPTVWLLRQQTEVLKKHLPCSIVSLSGEEVVDKWSPDVWAAVMSDAAGGVVMSTHQVLYDALAHGFVRLGKIPSQDGNVISLLIFDEAHHCMHNHPAQRIMRDFYFREKLESGSSDNLPAILGLTASPIVRARADDLKTVERNLDSIAKTPKVNKEELLRYVHPPTLQMVFYEPLQSPWLPLITSSPTSPTSPTHSRSLSLQSLPVQVLQSPPSIPRKARSPSMPSSSQSPNNFNLNQYPPSPPRARDKILPQVLPSSPRKANQSLPRSPGFSGLGAQGFVELSIEDIMNGGDFPAIESPMQQSPISSPSRARKTSFNSSPAHSAASRPQTAPRQSPPSRIERKRTMSDIPIIPSKNTIVELSIEDIMSGSYNQSMDGVTSTSCVIEPHPRPLSAHSDMELSIENIFLGGLRRSTKEPISQISVPEKTTPFIGRSPALESLDEVWRSMEIQEDPYVVYLRVTASTKLFETISKRNTYCQKQISSFYRRACYVFEEFGPWCAQMFVTQCTELFLQSSDDAESIGFTGFRNEEFSWESFGKLYGGGKAKAATMTGEELSSAEKRYLKRLLSSVKVSDPDPRDLESPGAMSPKLQKLVSTLIKEYNSEKSPKDFSGLVFVDQRAGVSVLSRVLSVHPQTAKLFDIGTLVGGSSNRKAKVQPNSVISEIFCPPNELSTLAEFRQGNSNLLISTSVGEEGIDIQACAVVVCYSLPQNLKAFIQRRGRARRVDSRCILMCVSGDEWKVDKLKELEITMKAAYEDDMRHLLEAAEAQEILDEDVEDAADYYFSTSKGLLTLDSAVPHLHHFCAVLPKASYCDTRPVFEHFKDLHGVGCVVTLPNCLPPELRRAESSKHWKSKRRAQQEAAFIAYQQLYRAGLLTESLLPLNRSEEDEETKLAKSGIEKRPSKVRVVRDLNPWCASEGWQEEKGAWCSTLHIDDSLVDLLTPFPITEHVPELELYMTVFDTISVKISSCLWKDASIITRDYGSWTNVRYYTRSVFFSTHKKRMPQDKLDFPYLIIPRGMHSACQHMNLHESPGAVRKLLGSEDLSNGGIIWDIRSSYKAYLAVGSGWVADAETNIEIQTALRNDPRYQGKTVSFEGRVIRVRPFPKRLDFLHRDSAPLDAASNRTEYLLADYCVIDGVSYRFTRNARYLPCVIRRIGISLIADSVRRELLAPCQLQESAVPLICVAISSSAAREMDNYQRLEFLGDSVLKYCVAIQVMAEYPKWHEGLLSAKKDHTVSNSTLARAAVAKKLARWIVTEQFSGTKWRPSYFSDFNDNESSSDGDAEMTDVLAIEDDKPEDGGRVLSTKILADVVESLIGACYLIGSFNTSLKCIGVFDLGIRLKNLNERAMEIYDTYQDQEWMHEPSKNFDHIEAILGYSFHKKTLLLEALTHPSYQAPYFEDRSMSYQRLEFLGDAVLDMIVVDELYKNGHEYHPRGEEYSHIDMHLYKSAVVNSDFLAFLCLDFAITVSSVELPTDDYTRTTVGEREFHFWKFLRQHSHALNKSIEVTIRNYKRLRARINRELGLSTSKDIDIGDQMDVDGASFSSLSYATEVRQYPWVNLAALQADKALSDIMESVLGAVYVDSKGNLDAVKRVVERMKILDVLRTLLLREIDPAHPVKKLGELAGKDLKTVRYEIEDLSPDESTGKICYECKVMVDDFAVAVVSDGSSWREARTRAAQLAYNLLSSNPPM